jgi:hypothetical protein
MAQVSREVVPFRIGADQFFILTKSSFAHDGDDSVPMMVVQKVRKGSTTNDKSGMLPGDLSRRLR